MNFVINWIKSTFINCTLANQDEQQTLYFQLRMPLSFSYGLQHKLDKRGKIFLNKLIASVWVIFSSLRTKKREGERNFAQQKQIQLRKLGPSAACQSYAF